MKLTKQCFEVFTDRFTVHVYAYSIAGAIGEFVQEFGTADPVIGVLSYDRVVRGNFIPKKHKKLPYCFIIKRNEPETPLKTIQTFPNGVSVMP